MTPNEEIRIMLNLKYDVYVKEHFKDLQFLVCSPCV